MRPRWLVVLALVLPPAAASAQPGKPYNPAPSKDAKPYVPKPSDKPRQPPPAPQAEKYDAKPGFTWVAGEWDWKNGKWEWQPGRWEKERPGKQWRASRWEKRGDIYERVVGAWIDGPAADDRPRQPPPAPQAESYGAKPGFTWVAGEWEWKGGKWTWKAGRWERERPGKQWRETRWEKRGDIYERVVGDWVAAEGPRQAPPAPQAEKYDAKPGFTWVAGEWDWKNGKWEWKPGRFERDRPGKQWRETRWELRNGAYERMPGDWIAAEPPRQPPPPQQVETYDPRPGFTWVAGEWDWKNGKWEWQAGRWEKEQTGKQWRGARWELKNGVYVRTPGAWAADERPRQPPPAPQAEKYEPRPGNVWVAGEWEWKAGKWQWRAGRWEAERTGQQWRPGRWDKDGDHYRYIDGEWVASGAQPPPQRERPRREWKLERPVVGSYWPIKGKAGSRVVIRGKNFTSDTTVIWAGQPLRGARVKDDEIAFVIPTGAASGQIAVKVGARMLPVGAFEVAADYDAAAELAKREAEARKAAEAAVAARNRALAADRAARRAAIQKAIDDRIASRAQRREQRLAELRGKWDRAFLADAETLDELTLHAQRVADLLRLGEIAQLAGNSNAEVRIEVLTSREEARHDQRMQTLKANFKGGRP
jgi:hypothetical protein